jgi:DNA-binding NarL/FixJ family response regulator
MIPLAGPEAQILRFLAQVIAIGKHRKAWTKIDVLRVAHQHLGGDLLRREAQRERARADRAETENQRLRERIGQLEHNLLRYEAVPLDDLPPRKVVDLTRSEFEVFALHCEGHQRQTIASELGIDKRTVSNYVSRVAGQVGADAARAAALVNRGVVVLRTKGRAA